MITSSLYVTLDAPQWDGADLGRLTDMLPAIMADAHARWASVRQQPMPAYRLWAEATDTGVAIGYRPRSGGSARACPALEFVRAAIRGALAGSALARPDAELSLDDRFAHLPCGTRPAASFREELWRQTGADVAGEEAEYTCACGRTHAIKLVE